MTEHHSWTFKVYQRRLHWRERRRVALSWGRLANVSHQYCTKCGTALIVPIPFRISNPRYLIPLMGVIRLLRKMPPCEGLPPDYDPPIGA